MLLPKPIAEGVRAGTVTLAFRRWDAPRVKVGGTQLTAAGLIRFDACVEVADPQALTDADAAAAGLASREQLLSRLEPHRTSRSPRGAKGGDTVYRITLSWAGEDPRVQLRQRIPRGAELAELQQAVNRLDAGRRSGPWTRQILEWIAAHPQVVSTELAAVLGRELQPMKTDIRKLKALGLTISHPVGYELSPRGLAYLASLPPGSP